VLRWRNLPEVRRWMYTDHEITEKEHDQWFESVLRDESRQYWVIMLDEQPVGVANLAEINRAQSRCTWAFYLADQSTRGRGIGLATEFLVLEYVFRDLRLSRLWCEVLSDNHGVIRLHESVGFHREGTLREHVAKSGVREDVVVLGMLASEWDHQRTEVKRRLAERGEVQL